MTSKLVKPHQPCGDCGSSDGLALYDDGHTYCFVCESRSNTADITVSKKDKTPKKEGNIRPIPEKFTDLADRKITEPTARKFGVTNFNDDSVEVKHVYPYYNKDGFHVANKLRRRDKKFMWEGEKPQATLFGQQLFPPGSAKAITLVEGECDALAAYQMQGSRYPCVSVHSASSAARDVAENFEYLNSFDKVVICFDKDEAKINPTTGAVHYPGQEAALAVAAMFPIGTASILTLSLHKDANDYLINGKSGEFVKEWWAAPTYTPSGLKLGKDMWDEISTPKNYETVPYPWTTLNAKTYGLRLSELVVLTGQTGDGKTSVVKEIEHYILGNSDKGIGFLHLEEPNSDTALGLMSITADKPLHLPDVRKDVNTEELRGYYDKVINNDRVVIWDHFGSNDIHEVLAKIRHMHNLGCKYIFLDHLSIVVSDQSGDERKQLDEITTKLKTLCMELNIAVVAVIHQNRQGQIRGTAGVEQLANIVIKLYRDKTDPDEWRRNVTKIVIEKNRFCGMTGPATWVWYNPMTGRLEELNDEEVKKFEAGASAAGMKEEAPW